MVSGPITLWQIDGETVETVSDLFLGAPKSLQMVIAAMKLKDACSLEMLDWKKQKLESRLPGEVSITSDMQIGRASCRERVLTTV